MIAFALTQQTFSKTRKVAHVLSSLFMPILTAAAVPCASAQTLHYQQVVNTTGAPRDDLHVVVSQAVTGKFKAPPFTRQSLTPGKGGKEMDFDQGVVNPGELAGVRWVNAFKTDMILEGYWTLGGVPKEPIKTNPVRSQPNILPDGTVILSFQNTSSTPVTYIGLRVVNGANLSMFDLDNFVAGMNTGTPVDTLVPPDGTLPPGNTDIASFPACPGAPASALGPCIQGYIAVDVNIGAENAETATAWTVDRTGSTSFNFLPGSNDRSIGSVVGPYNNLFQFGGSQPNPPTGQVSGAILALNSFGGQNTDFAGGSLTDNHAPDTSDFFNTGIATADGGVFAAGASISADRTNSAGWAVKYVASGNRDSTYGAGGEIVFQASPGTLDQATSIVPLPSGNTALLGQSCSGPTCQSEAVLYDPNGTLLKSTLDSHGKGVLAAQLASNGFIYALVQADNPMGDQAFAFVRFDQNLNYDTVFGLKTYNDSPFSTDIPEQIQWDPFTNRFYIVGFDISPGPPVPNGEIMAFDVTTGLPIPSFGNNGRVKLSIGAGSELFGLTVPPGTSGKLTVVGTVQPSPSAPLNGLTLVLSSNGETGSIAQFSSPGNDVLFTSVTFPALTEDVVSTGFQLGTSGLGREVAASYHLVVGPNLQANTNFGDLVPSVP